MFGFLFKKHPQATKEQPRQEPPAMPTPLATVPAPFVPPRGYPTPQKFTEAEQHRICELLAQYRPITEICTTIHQESGKTIGERTVYHYREGKKWQPVIARYRERFMARLQDVPGFHKRIRLERLENQYTLVEREGLDKSPRRRKEAREILAEERAESERATPGSVHIHLEQMSDEELQRRREELVRMVVNATTTTPEVIDASEE